MGLGQSALVMGAEGISSSEISMSSPEDWWPWKKSREGEAAWPRAPESLLNIRKSGSWIPSCLTCASRSISPRLSFSICIKGIKKTAIHSFNKHVLSTCVPGSGLFRDMEVTKIDTNLALVELRLLDRGG
jgi:hypothetical protein